MVAAAPRTAEAPPQDLWRFLLMLWRPDEVRELRIPKHNTYGNTASGYFDNPEKLADAIPRWDGKANLYLTLNPVNPALLANRIVTKTEKTTSDVEVKRRSWLLLDVDPNRPSGISSTDEELASARDVLERVTAFLAEPGWPEPATAMSGNGYYALHRIDLPNDEASSQLVPGVLRALAKGFDTKRAHVDTTVGNAARIDESELSPDQFPVWTPLRLAERMREAAQQIEEVTER